MRCNINNATCPGMFRGPARFRLSRWSKLLVVAAVLETLALLAICIATIIRPGAHVHSFLYSMLAIICLLSFFYYTVDAVYTENEFQLMYSLVISVLLTMFVAFSVFNRNDDRDLGPAWKLTKYPVLALKLCFQVIYLALAFPVKRSFGYYLYKIASASIHLQELFAQYLSYLSLLKFDMLLTVIVLLMLNAENIMHSAAYIVGITMVVATLFWSLLGWYAVTKEHRALLFVFGALAVLKFVYVAYNLYELWEHPSSITVAVTYTQYAVVGGLSLFVRTLLLLYTWRVYKGFGRGLRTEGITQL